MFNGLNKLSDTALIDAVDNACINKNFHISKLLREVYNKTFMNKTKNTFGEYYNANITRDACEYGNIITVKWIFGSEEYYDSSVCCFKIACVYGNLEIAKFLYSLGEVNFKLLDKMFMSPVLDINILRWMSTLSGIYEIKIEEGYIKTRILTLRDFLDDKKQLRKLKKLLDSIED